MYVSPVIGLPVCPSVDIKEKTPERVIEPECIVTVLLIVFASLNVNLSVIFSSSVHQYDSFFWSNCQFSSMIEKSRLSIERIAITKSLVLLPT